MSDTNRLLLVLLPIVAVVIAFWLLVLSPTRQEASELEIKAGDLQAQVNEQTEAADAAEAARKEFPRAYQRLVVLGKATPTDDDTSSLLVQLSRIAEKSGVAFVSLDAQAGDTTGAAPPPAPMQTPAETAEQDEQRVENVEGGGDAAPPAPVATEAQAALLPIGASVGPAGLPVMKYSLSFNGRFFRLADFLAGIDKLVTTRADGRVGVRGRLITVDSFDLSPTDSETPEPTAVGAVETPSGASLANPELAADFTITTYLTPPDEGTTGGASPTGPAPAAAPQPTAAPAPAGGSTATAATTSP